MKTCFPLLFEFVQPMVDFFQGFGFRLIKYFATNFFLAEQIAFIQDVQVFGDRLAAAIEVLCDGIGCHGLCGEEQEDGSAGGVGNGLKNIASHAGRKFWIG